MRPLGKKIVKPSGCVEAGMLTRSSSSAAAFLYAGEGFPWWLRNSPFALIPSGIAFVLFGAATLVLASGHDQTGSILVVSAIAVGAVGLFPVHQPPLWLQPRWMRDPDWRREQRPHNW
jgi:hypothetical protein